MTDRLTPENARLDRWMAREAELLDALDAARSELDSLTDSLEIEGDWGYWQHLYHGMEIRAKDAENRAKILDARLAEAISVGAYLNCRAVTAEQRVEVALALHDGYTGACGDEDHCSLDLCPECVQHYPCDTRMALQD